MKEKQNQRQLRNREPHLRNQTHQRQTLNKTYEDEDNYRKEKTSSNKSKNTPENPQTKKEAKFGDIGFGS